MATLKPSLEFLWAEAGGVTDPGAIKTQEGWISEIPTFQVFNWVLNRSDQFAEHVNIEGIPIWDAVTIYDLHSLAKGSNGVIYKSLGVANTNNNPTLDTTGINWVPDKSLDIIGKNLVAIIEVNDVASAVNYLAVTNSATGNNLILEAKGTDPSISIDINAKAGGEINLNATTVNVNAGLLQISTVSPQFKIHDSDGALDTKFYRIRANAGVLIYDIHNDANTVAAVYMQVNRTANVIDAITLTATVVTLSASTVNLSTGMSVTNNGSRLNIDGTSPQIIFNETDAGLDLKISDVVAENNSLFYRIRSDNGTNNFDYMQIDRSALAGVVTVDAITLQSNIIEAQTQNFIISGNTAAFLTMKDEDAALNEKLYLIATSGVEFSIRTATDGGTTVEKPITITRNTTNVTNITLTATTINLEAKVEIKTVNWTGAIEIGTPLATGGTGTPDITALSSDAIAFIDSTQELLQRYIFRGTWLANGTALSIPGIGTPRMAALSSTDIAFVDGVLDTLRTYRFNGSTWVLVGSALSIPMGNNPSITALNSTDIAFIDETNDSLRTYRFNGTTWALVGTGLTIAVTAFSALAALNGTDVAFANDGSNLISTYRFNGSTWSKVGNSVSYIMGPPDITALNSTDIAIMEQGTGDLAIFRFDGTDWSKATSYDHFISGTGVNRITALNSTDIAFTESVTDELRVYRFGWSLSELPPSRIITG